MDSDLFDFLDNDAAPVASAVEDAPQSDPAPDEDSAPPEQESEASPLEPVAEAETPADENEAEPQQAEAEAQPEPVDWRTLPEAQALIAEAQEMQRLRQVAEQAKAIQAQNQLARTIEELSEGDTERHGQILNVLAQVAQPLQQQAQALDQRATQGEKALTAFLVAAQAQLDPSQFEQVKAGFQALMALEGPEAMERHAFAERDAAKKYTAELTDLRQKNDELKRRLAAQVRLGQRQANGADLVDSGGRGMPPAQRTNTTFDEDFEAMWRGNH